MHLTKKIAAAAGALTLGAVSAAAAATPDAADAGLSKASAQVGVELPASRGSHPGPDEHAHDDESPEDEDITAEDEDDNAGVDETEDGAGTPDHAQGHGPEGNHGAEVSAVARSDETTGREHGEAVSEVARQNHGQETSGKQAEKRP